LNANNVSSGQSTEFTDPFLTHGIQRGKIAGFGKLKKQKNRGREAKGRKELK
jgi:hypothetical protein